MTQVIQYPWDKTPRTSPREKLALSYAARGWHVFPLHEVTATGHCSCANPSCERQGKHPRTSSGLNDATTNQTSIRSWWNQWPNANIGVRTGRVSGVFVVDVDNHVYFDGKDGEASLQTLLSDKGALPDTLEAITGGSGGRHLFFSYPTNLEGGIKSRTDVLGPGLDIRGDGGYVVAPGSAGLRGAYDWEGSSDPDEGAELAQAPEWLIQLVQSSISKHDGGDYTGTGEGFLLPETEAELRAALTHLDPDADYDRWVQVGMALKSTDAGERAYVLWDEWSQRGPKYSPQEVAYKWRTFSTNGGLTRDSIFYWAAQAGWINPRAVTGEPTPPVVDASPVWVPPEAPAFGSVQELPGRLGEIYEWAMRTAHRPQPQLTVNAILAGMSAIMGRKYRTESGVWPALYFLNVAKSSAGKEHGKTVAEAMLEAADLGTRIAGGGYTSSGAVFSQLESRPAHIAIIDEMGKALGSAQARGNQHKLDAITSLIEAWGRCNGILRPPSYSAMTASASLAESIADRHCVNPSITILGMSTPTTFYQSIASSWVDDGFLSRMLVVESPIGRQPGRFPMPEEMPQHLQDWLKSVATVADGNVANAESPILRPIARVVGVTDAAQALFRDFEVERIELANSLDEYGLGELVNRDVEKAIRIALIVSAGATITDSAAAWAMAYVMDASDRLIESVRDHMHDSEFSGLKALVTDIVRAAKPVERGVTHRELTQKSRQYRGLQPLEQERLMAALTRDGVIELVSIQTGRGRARQAWVAIQGEGE